MFVRFALVMALCAAAATAQETVELQTATFVTKLDHFQLLDERTVNITYHANLNHYQPGGPFYIYIKDTIDHSTQWIEHGLMVDIARNTSGALFTYDPRFYGENIVTETADLQSLQLLTPEQALEDLATFIEHLNAEFSDAEAKVVWGTGYGATFATYARKKYPHLINAAWSSSGIFDVRLTSLGVIDTLSYTIHRAAGYECRNRLSEALWQLNTLVTSGDAEQIASDLSLCSVGNLTDPQEVGMLFETLLYYIIDNVESRHTLGVRTFCDALEVPAGRPLQALGRWLNYVYGNDECREVSYASLVQREGGEQWHAASSQTGIRQSIFTQCTQAGLFQITDSITWLPNRISIDYYVRRCEDILGAGYRFEHLQRANAAMARRYGSLYQDVTKVLYTNGMIDPWFTHGIVYSRDARTVVLNIEHFARSADLTSIAEGSEAVELTRVKEQIFEQLVQWSRE